MLTTGDHGTAARILLIEDNDGDVFLFSMALRNAGFPHTLTTIQDGADAMEFLRSLSTSSQLSPDLILLDINLPRVDGTTILDLLRSEPDLQEIPVILLSSSRSPFDAARVGGIKRSIFIVKPSDLDEFMEIGYQVRRFLQETREQGVVSSG